MLKFTIYCPILEKPTRCFAWFSRIVSGSLILQLFGRDHFSFRQILRPWGGETPAIEQWGVRPPLPRGSSGGSPCGEGEVGGGGDDTSPWNPIRQRDSAGRWGVRQGLGLPRGAALAAHWVSHDRSLFPRLGTSLGPRRAPLPPYNAADGQSRVRPGRAGMGTVRPSSSAHCLSFFFSLAKVLQGVYLWIQCFSVRGWCDTLMGTRWTNLYSARGYWFLIYFFAIFLSLRPLFSTL